MPRQRTTQRSNKNENFERISWGTNFLMISLAVVFDATQAFLDLIPFIGWLVSSALAGFAYFLFWFIWKLNGVKFWERQGGRYARKIILRFGGSALFEVTLSFVPALTIFVVATNSLLRSEDKLVQEGVITPEEVNRIGEIIIQHDVQSASELLKLARDKAQKRAQRRVRRAVKRHRSKLVGSGIINHQRNKPRYGQQNYQQRKPEST